MAIVKRTDSGIRSFVCGLLTLLLLVSCGEDNFSSVPTLPGAGAVLPQSTGTTSTVKHLQPALAVRGVACLACHAQINANVITDFGNGDAWYLGQTVRDWSSLSASTIAYGATSSQSQYDPFTLQSLHQVIGQITTPVGSMPGSAVATSVVGASSPASAMDLASYLTLSNITNLNPGWTESNASALSFTKNVTPGTDSSGNALPAVVEKNTVYIGSASPQQILGIAGASAPSLGGVQVVGQVGSGLNGMTKVTGANGTPYLTNSTGSTIECVNQDVVFNGSVFLNNLSIHATQGGCRFYVTGPVFIQGQITYTQDPDETNDTTSNLQISSATAIIMGVGLSNPNGKSGTGPNPLHNRLIDDSRNAIIREAPSNSSYLTWANAVYQEGVNIGNSSLIDAADLSAYPGYSTALSENGETRVSIPFSHLLLNAPVIHNRYLGQVSGVFVAEFLIPSLGEFHYEYDSVFNSPQVSILPLLPGDILCVADASSDCSPISSP